MLKLRHAAVGLAMVTGFVAWGASAQSLGPDYGQRGLPGGSDTMNSGSDLVGSDTRPVACIYKYTHRIPRADVMALIENGYVAKTGKEKMAFQLIGETIAACRTGNGWSPKRQDLALKFFSARILTEDALFQGKDLGLTGNVVRALDGRLDSDTKAAFSTGHPDDAHLATAMGQLKTAGLDPDKLTAQQRQTLATLVAQALWGLHQQSAIADAYKAG